MSGFSQVPKQNTGMEFQEGLMKIIIKKHVEGQLEFLKREETEAVSSKLKWGLFRRSSFTVTSKPQNQQTPKELLCPISGSLMADPVIVSSGHTFERTCVQVCKALNFTPTLIDSSKPDFSSVIPNLALKTTILSWCRSVSKDPPKPLDLQSAEKLVRKFIASQETNTIFQNQSEVQKVIVTENELIQRVQEKPTVNFNHAATELTRRSIHIYSSSEEMFGNESALPLQFATRPSCYSSSSSPDIETLNPNPCNKEEEFLKNLKSPQIFEVEEAVISLRKITRTTEEIRSHLCTPRLLSTLRSLITSRYTAVQVNSVAALVNLSLDKANKVKIVRSGIVPPLVLVLKSGSPEGQEHASGALFSLALEDHNKTAIGVLGALPPLLHCLRSERERTRHDSALALYHLTLVQSNRSKLVKLGSIPVLLAMAKSGHMTGRVMLILCNLGSSIDGRVAMLDVGAVECLVGMLRSDELDSTSSRESCVAALYSLSHGGLRFKGLALEAGAMEVLRKVEREGSERAKEKAMKMLEMMKVRVEEEEEEVDWEALLDSGLESRSHSRCRLGGVLSNSRANSSEF